MSKKMWSGTFEDTLEGYDYGTVKYLITQCKKDGFIYKVIRRHKNGTTSIIKQG